MTRGGHWQLGGRTLAQGVLGSILEQITRLVGLSYAVHFRVIYVKSEATPICSQGRDLG
jgi:hypothetical protein